MSIPPFPAHSVVSGPAEPMVREYTMYALTRAAAIWRRQQLEEPSPAYSTDEVISVVLAHLDRVDEAWEQRGPLLVNFYCDRCRPLYRDGDRRVLARIFDTPLGLLLDGDGHGGTAHGERTVISLPSSHWWPPQALEQWSGLIPAVNCRRHGTAWLDLQELVNYAVKARRHSSGVPANRGCL